MTVTANFWTIPKVVGCKKTSLASKELIFISLNYDDNDSEYGEHIEFDDNHNLTFLNIENNININIFSHKQYLCIIPKRVRCEIIMGLYTI